MESTNINTTAQQASTPDGGSGAQIVNDTAGAANAEPEKKYTQAELDAAIGQRLARERRGMPSADELGEFRAWRESRQTEQERQQRILEERNGYEQRVNALEAELTQAQRERTLLSLGVPVDDVDYYAYKIGKMVSDTVTFEQAAAGFVRDHAPAKNAASSQGVRASFGAPMGQGAKTESLAERINRQLRGG